mgnify:CR=1 FL=1
MFRHTDTVPLVLSPVDSDTETEMIDNKNADKLAFKYNKSFSDFSFSPFKKVTKSPALLVPPSSSSVPGSQSHRSCPDLASLPRAQVDSDQVRLIGYGRDESEDLLTSQWGDLSVTRQGATRGPVLVTLHDIGLDYKSNFEVYWIHVYKVYKRFISRFSSRHVTWRVCCQGSEFSTCHCLDRRPGLDHLLRLRLPKPGQPRPAHYSRPRPLQGHLLCRAGGGARGQRPAAPRNSE